MKLVKEKDCEYWVNDRGEWHGEYKWWDENGQLREHSFYVNDVLHGEYKSWWENGQIQKHCFWVNGEEVRDLIEEPVTDEDKFLMTLETGAKWLCN